VTADHWGFVIAAYGLAAIVLTVYWRHLCRRDRELTDLATNMINRKGKRSQVVPTAGHPRSEPASPTPLQ
jgi:hypothetical protein